ncbi:hypothetical protein D9M69_624310 [compost metagenome]
MLSLPVTKLSEVLKGPEHRIAPFAAERVVDRYDAFKGNQLRHAVPLNRFPKILNNVVCYVPGKNAKQDSEYISCEKA